jgi:carboxymethylenebutenolidase
MAGKGRTALAAILLLLAACAPEKKGVETRLTGAIVEYGRGPSGAPLRGALYLPKGPGPFPVLLYAHGSAPGGQSNAAFEAIAPDFTRRGWAVFAPYRRGQGLSSDAGPYIRDDVAAARSQGGPDRAQARLANLLAGDHMDDQSAAFSWLSRQPFADPGRIAAMGNSFGGVIALLSADRLAVCGAVDASGGAESWGDSPALRKEMVEAAGRARPPIMFLQAANDFDLRPSRDLHAARRRSAKASELRIYPRFGKSAREGHSFPYRGVAIWSGDVHAFLSRACPLPPSDSSQSSGPG